MVSIRTLLAALDAKVHAILLPTELALVTRLLSAFISLVATCWTPTAFVVDSGVLYRRTGDVPSQGSAQVRDECINCSNTQERNCD